VKYVVASRAVAADGAVSKNRDSFSTQDLSLDEQTYASVQPLKNEVVGVGMPVIVQFDIPVHNKRAFEKHMTVTADPVTAGTWHWVSDQEVHWRPKHYWQAGTKVHVDVNVNGVSAGNGIYGQLSRHVDFTVGRSVIMKANLASDEMKVLINGSLARTIPITGGKAGFETRSGIKLIVEKFYVKQMDSATVGIQPGSPEYYNIPDVYYAQRVTFSGEFLHAAPWSVYAQGAYNVSHGCVGMSTENAAWLYGITHRGDPVVVSGTSRGLEENNGWTDWDQSFKEYKQASALS
jgi:lipoprotein-anchoring transpeptidase ErfK/SrfK